MFSSTPALDSDPDGPTSALEFPGVLTREKKKCGFVSFDFLPFHLLLLYLCELSSDGRLEGIYYYKQWMVACVADKGSISQGIERIMQQSQ
jgi:hypothetical protein